METDEVFEASKIRKVLGAILAISRMTLKMRLWHARRAARDYVVPKIGSLYEIQLEKSTAKIPIPNFLNPSLIRASEQLVPYAEAAHGVTARTIKDGKVEFFGIAVDFGSAEKINWMHCIDNGNHQLWRQKLSFFGFAVLVLSSGRAEDAQLVRLLVQSFENQIKWNVPRVFRDPWNSYAVAQRVLNLTAGLALYAHASGSLAGCDEIIQFLRRNVAFLLNNLEYELGFNHLERNLAALTLYTIGLNHKMPDLENKLDREIRRLIKETIGSDGMQRERSPLYQGLTVLSLRIFNFADFLSSDTNDVVKRTLPEAEAAWLHLAHTDGDLALFNDCWLGEVPAPVKLLNRPAPMGSSTLHEAGYIRLASQDEVCIFDVGPVGPSENPGHAHSDFLSFELSAARARIVVDPGTFNYSVSAHRMFSRYARAHNGPHLPGIEPVDYFGSFRVGRLAAARGIDVSSWNIPYPLAAGVLRARGYRVARCVVLFPGAGLLILDVWNQKNGKVRILIPEKWNLLLCDEQKLKASQGPLEVLVMRGSRDKFGLASWSPRYLQLETAFEIQISANIKNEAVTWIGWAGRDCLLAQKEIQFLIDELKRNLY